MNDDIKKKLQMIKKFGKCKRPPAGKDKGLYIVVCQGCGKQIKSDDVPALEDIDFSITKRGDGIFWHRGCYEKVWKEKIKWEID